MEITVRLLVLTLLAGSCILAAEGFFIGDYKLTSDYDDYYRINHASEKRSSYRNRAPEWRPCLTMCVDGCIVYKKFDLQHCARQCLRHGIKGFEPITHCFNYNSVLMV